METLGFYDVENAAIPTTLAIGTVAPSSSDDTMLRVINNSDLYQAEDVTVTISGPDAIELWLSTDGDTYSSSIDVGDIPPGGVSGTFWLRRVTASDSASGGHSGSLVATPAGWASPVDTSASVNIPLTTED